jgi:hypothetical protein
MKSLTTPCKRGGNCIQFQDFVPSSPNDKLYVNKAQNVTVACPSGSTSVVPIPAGVVGYVVKFAIGDAPYPNLTLNCTGGALNIPVPDDVTQGQLDDLVNGMIQTCVNQIAQGVGCAAGSFFNTQQAYSPCPGNAVLVAAPAGVSLAPGSSPNGLVMMAGIVESTISVADANSKAQQVLQEIFFTGNASCFVS